MGKNAEKRIELLEKIKNDTNTIEVRDVTEIFSGVLKMLSEHSVVYKKVKNKCSKDEWTAFLHGFINSFLSSLYASAGKDVKETKERTRYVAEVNSDVMLGFAASKKEYDA